MARRAILLLTLAALAVACTAAPTPPASPPTDTAPPATATVAASPTPAVTVTPLIGFAPETPTLAPTIDPSLVPTPTITPTPVITAAPSEEATVGQYEVYEQSFSYVSSLYNNPWDDATLTVTFVAPSGTPSIVGGFYYGPDTWLVRFAPAELGSYTWSSDFTDPFGTRTDEGEFNVVESEAHGFAHASPDNHFRWVFDDGTPYYPIGLQDCLNDRDNNGDPFDDLGLDGDLRANPEELGTRVSLTHYLDVYSRAGFNLWRWGADNCGFKLWEEIDPEGNTYSRQAGRFGDTLVSALRARGFRIYANIFASDPPFPDDAADGPKMNAVIRYVRYFIARYGAYVDYWELMNEATASDDWYNLIANTVRQADPYHHPIATNWERPDIILIDVNSPHWYETEDEFSSDAITAQKITSLRRWGKPIIFSEQGNGLVNWDPRSALRMRLRAWTAFFEEATLIFWNSSFARDYIADGAANIYLGPEERGYVRALQQFTDGFDPTAEPVDVSTSNPLVRAYGLSSSEMFAAYLVNSFDHSNATGGVNVTADMPGGTATWYDPATGDTLGSLQVEAGRRTLTAPNFVTDVALKVEP
jgi:Domain of unknown function (DUF5060)